MSRSASSFRPLFAAVLVGLASAQFAACGARRVPYDPAEPRPLIRQQRPVVASVQEGRLEIHNRTGERLRFEVFPAEILQRIEWAACATPRSCDEESVASIAPQGRVRLDVERLAGPRTRELIVITWRLAPCEQGDGWCVRDRRQLRVAISRRHGIA